MRTHFDVNNYKWKVIYGVRSFYFNHKSRVKSFIEQKIKTGRKRTNMSLYRNTVEKSDFMNNGWELRD